MEQCRLSAHKTILAARSQYFRSLLYGDLAESKQNEIELKVPLEAFKRMLSYIYTGCIHLDKMKVEDIVDTLSLANLYGFETLELAISGYLQKNLTLESCCSILESARLCSLKSLLDVCMRYMDHNSSRLLNHNTFNELSQESLCCLLKRDSFFAPEAQIFTAVKSWCKNNPDADIEVNTFVVLS